MPGAQPFPPLEPNPATTDNRVSSTRQPRLTMDPVHKLIDHLLKFSHRPEWEGELVEVWTEHLAQTADFLDLEDEELEEQLEEAALVELMFPVVFEDFATREQKDSRNFLQIYRKRAGWRKPAKARQYLGSLR